MGRNWCPQCESLHGRDDGCPGDLGATGPERHGYRVHVETRRGVESIGVLVAPTRDGWRARILTFPNVLWCTPGGGGTMKFVGGTPQEAEAKAIEYVERHCLERGFVRRNDLAPVQAGPVALELAGSRAAATAGQNHAPLRKLRSLPIVFGAGRPSRPGMTVNLSKEGMFVATPDPLDVGTPVRIQLDLEGYPIGLDGLVMWNRLRRQPGRPLGMGVRLVSPAPGYVRYWHGLP